MSWRDYANQRSAAMPNSVSSGWRAYGEQHDKEIEERKANALSGFDVLDTVQPKAKPAPAPAVIEDEPIPTMVTPDAVKERLAAKEQQAAEEEQRRLKIPDIREVRQARQKYYEALDNGKDATAEKKALDDVAAKYGIDPNSNLFGMWLKNTGASIVNTAGTLLDAANQGMAQQVDTTMLTADVLSGKTKEEGYKAPTRAVYNEETAKAYKEKYYDVADELKAKADKEYSDITQGRSKGGKLAVDLANQGLNLLSDTLANQIIPGAGLANLAVRSFGSSTQEARQAGADTAQQLAYGAATALTEVLTEKLGGAFAKAYGKTASADLVNYVAGKLAKTDAGQTALTLLFKSLGEGGEEVIADGLNPFFKSIYNGKAGWENFSELDAGDVAYDFLVGSILGFFGEGANIAANGGEASKVEKFFRQAAADGNTFKEACTAWTIYEEAIAPNEANFNANVKPQIEAQKAADEAADAAVPTVEATLAKGRVNVTTAKDIVNDPAKRSAFTQITGIPVSGTEAEQVKTVQREARNFAYEQVLARQEEMRAEAEARTQAQTAAENEAVRNSGYDSYVRGMYNSGKITTADATEIANSAELRATWESMTGKTLPENIKSAVKMIRQTDVNTAKVNLNDPLAFLFEDNTPQQNAQNGAQTQEAPAQQITPETAQNAAEAANETLNSQQAEETESTSVNDNPQTHTPEEMRIIEEYKKSTDETLCELLKDYEENGIKKFARHNISNVMPKQASKLSSLFGKNFSDYINAINTNAIKHIFSEHGKNGTVNHSMEDLNDLARVGYVLENFDDAYIAEYKSGDQKFSKEFRTADNSPAPTVVFSKKVNGTYYVVEAIPDSQYKKLWVVSAYMDKKGGVTQASSANSPENTAKPSLASPPQSEDMSSKAKVSQLSANVNMNFAEGIGESAATIKESGYSQNIKTDTARSEAVRKAVENDPFYYETASNKETLDKALQIYDKGFEVAKRDLLEKIGAAKAGKKLPIEYIPLSKLVADEMARNGDAEGAREILSDISVELTEMGQKTQAAAILRELDPTAKTQTIEKFIDRLNKRLTKGQKKTNVKRGVGTEEGMISVPQELLDEFSNAETDEARDAALDKIMDSAASQIPSTFSERVTAIRYLNMLGNLKTQERNFVGNVFMKTANLSKNALATGVEQLASAISGGKVERTKSLFTSKELKAQARADFENVKNEAMGENKYTPFSRFSKDVQDRRQIFNNKGLEAYRNATTDAMEGADELFVKWEYTQALAGWMKAHGIDDMSTATAEQLERGRAYAVKQAQEVTFRDSNAVSDFMSALGRSENVPTGVKTLVEGVIPFRKTPANVAVRAFEYSPLGIAQTISKATKGADAAEIINSAAKNATGSAILLAGFFLAAKGLARTKEDDEELEYFEEQQGAQEYSVKVGNTWVSISQFAPMAIPFLMGTALYEATQDDISPKDFIKVIDMLTTPMVEMSMLSAVNDLLENVSSFNGDGYALGAVLIDAGLSYLTQVLTNTAVGQFEQATEKNRMTYYTTGDSPLTRGAQKAISKASAKTPGVDYQQEEYVDAWGRTQSNGSTGERVFNAFINPTYYSKDRSESVDAEIQRIYEDNKDVAGFPNVLPQKVSHSMKLSDGTTMTSDEYVAFSKDSGQQKLELVTDFLDSEEYKGMTDEQRAKVIKRLYEFANDRALKKIEDERGNDKKSDLDKVDDALEADEIAEYYAVKAVAGDAYDNKSFDVLDGILASYGNLSDGAKTLLDTGSTANLDKIYDAMGVGISSSEWNDAYEEKRAIEEKSKTANQKATEFSNYLDNAGYSKKQKRTLLEQMGFYAQIRGEAEKYDALSESFDSETAYAVTEAMQGKSTDIDKATAIGGVKGLKTDKDKLKALHAYFPVGSDGKEKAIYRRYTAAVEAGFSYDDWTKVEKAAKDKNKTEKIDLIMATLGADKNTATKIYNAGW